MAGGEARRFPGKLEHRIGGRPCSHASTIALRARDGRSISPPKDRFRATSTQQLDAPLLIDRRPARGPLSALLSACALVRAERIFAVAADQPHLDAHVAAAARRSVASRATKRSCRCTTARSNRSRRFTSRRARSARGFRAAHARGVAMRDLSSASLTRPVPMRRRRTFTTSIASRICSTHETRTLDRRVLRVPAASSPAASTRRCARSARSGSRRSS